MEEGKGLGGGEKKVGNLEGSLFGLRGKVKQENRRVGERV